MNLGVSLFKMYTAGSNENIIVKRLKHRVIVSLQ